MNHDSLFKSDDVQNSKTRHDVQHITLPGRVGAFFVLDLKGLNVGHAIHLIFDADVGELLFDELILNQCRMAMELKHEHCDMIKQTATCHLFSKLHEALATCNFHLQSCIHDIDMDAHHTWPMGSGHIRTAHVATPTS